MKYSASNIIKYCSGMLIALLAVTSCLQEEDPMNRDQIRLKGSIVPANVFTKGEGPIDSQYAQDLIIGMARIDEHETPGYPFFRNTGLQLKAKMAAGETNPNKRDISFVDKYQQFNNATDYIKYASWYPYSPDTYDQASHSVTTPIDGNTDIMYGSIATGNQKNGFTDIYFDHALSKFTFHVYAMVQEDFTQEQLDQLWGKLKNINIIGLADQCKITLPDKELDTYKIEYLNEKESNLISIAKPNPDAYLLNQFPIGAANAKEMPALIAAPPSDGVLKVKVETDNGKANHQISSKTMTIARNFKPGKNYEIFLRFSDHGLINAEVAIGEWIGGGEVENDKINNEIYYDLSTAEHSNCYIVTSANYSYCFDVTTKGNGPIGSFGGTDTKLTPGYLDIIWMDDGLQDYFHMENHEPIQNRVLFSVTNDESNADPVNDTNKVLSKEGNVLIGAYNMNPAEGGELLWAWHIWLTDRPVEQAYKNGFVVLDRDLGAIADNVTEIGKVKELDGLYYQWGRPTPLPLGRTAIKPEYDANGKLTGKKSFTIKDAADAADLNTRISHPENFYTESGSIESMTDYKGLWGFNINTLEYRKTMYDPCPPGYRLPSKSMFTHMDHMNINLNKVHGHSYVSTVDTYYEMNNALSGYYTDSKTRVGYFADKNAAVEGNTGAYLWSGTLNLEVTPQPAVWSPYSLDCILNPNKTPKEGTITPHEPHHALPVRCVSKRSIPETRDLSAYQTANSYIVSKTGYYKFKATVRGNGINKLVAPGSGAAIDITENVPPDIADKAYKVVPLWWQGDMSSADNHTNGTSNNTPDGNPDENDPNNSKYKVPVNFINDGLVTPEGYVYFSLLDSRKGNLIVAAKDQLGNILWSWHLWLTDEPKNHNSNDFAVMDRFLGATFCPTAAPTPQQVLGSLGLFYEWSRKDPFPGPGAVNANKYSTWWMYNETDGKWIEKKGLASTTNVPEEKTVAASVADPTRYHLSQDDIYNGGDVPTENFYVNPSDNLMVNQCFSNTLHQDAMWGYSSMSGGIGKTTTKTMYDPCPPGYSVAYYLLWTNAKTGDATEIYTKKDDGVIYANGITERREYGIFLTHPNFSKTWYPYAGYIDSSDGTLRQVGAVGRFHSSTPLGFGSRSLAYWYDGNVRTMQAVGGGWLGIPSTFAYPVRCQKD